jgi:hypothetical protein
MTRIGVLVLARHLRSRCRFGGNGNRLKSSPSIKEWERQSRELRTSNLHKELFDVKRFADVAEMRRKPGGVPLVALFTPGRTHHALGGLLVPADRQYLRTSEEVLHRIEAGAGDELATGSRWGERCLVSSRCRAAGRVGAWLLGRKLPGLPDQPEKNEK